MPKNRVLVTDQDTYDYSTPNFDVVARPTDPYVTPEQSSTGQLVQALSAFQSGLQSFGEYREIKNQEDREKGLLERAKSPETPLGKRTKAFIEGWERLDGELKAKQDYQKEVYEFSLNNAETADEKEFMQGLAEISQKYTAGAPKEFLQSFVETALSIETKAKSNYYQIQNERVLSERNTQITALLNQDIPQIVLEAFTKTTGINVSNLEDIQNNYISYFGNQDEIKKEMSEKLRSYLDGKFNEYKSLKLSTKDISLLTFNVAASIANQYGMPELIEYAYLKDSKGIAVNDNPELAPLVEEARIRAENSQQEILKTLNSKLQAKHEQDLNLKINSTIVQLSNLKASNLDDRTTALNAWNSLTSDLNFMSNAPRETVTAIQKLAKSVYDPDADNGSLDDFYITKAMTDYVNGRLSKNTILEALANVSTEKKNTFVTLWDKYLNESNSNKPIKLSSKNKTYYDNVMRTVNSYISSTKELLDTEKTTISGIISIRLVEEIINKNRDLTLDDMKELKEKVKFWLDEDVFSKPKETKITDNKTTSTTKRMVYDPKLKKVVEVTK